MIREIMDARFQQLQDNAETLRELLQPIRDNDHTNTKIYRAFYLVNDAMVSACLVLKAGEGPRAQVTKRFGDNLTSSQQLQSGTINAMDHAVFLGLDECYPRIPQWKLEKYGTADLIIMRDAIGHPINTR